MATIIPGLDNVNWFPIIGQFVYWFSIIMGGIIIVLVIFLGYYILQFKIKATVFPMYGSGKDGAFSFGKPKTNRVKWNRDRTSWKKLFPINNRLEVEPFDSEYMYPKDRIFVFELNDQWIPGRININKTEDEIRAEINPVPYYIRNWQSLQHKKNAIEFAKQSWWEDNKHLMMTIMTVFACTALAGAVIYFTYQFAQGGRADIQILTEAINRFGDVNAGR